MKEDISININTINKYYNEFGLDKKLDISIKSLINKISNNSFDNKTNLILDSLFLLELILNKKISLQQIYLKLTNENKLRQYLKSNFKYLINNKYNKLIMIIDNEKEFSIIYNNIIKSNFLNNLQLITNKDTINNNINKRLKELDLEMQQLIDKYNKTKQIQKNVYLSITGKKIMLKTKPFWKMIPFKYITKYSNKIILGFSNTYGNDNGFFFIEDFNKCTKEEYSIWINKLLNSYLNKKDLKIINYEIVDDLNLYYKMPNKDYYIFISTMFNKYDNHIYKFIKTSLNEDYDKYKLMYEINSFKTEEELEYSVQNIIKSDLFGNIKYDYNEKKYIFKYKDIIFKLNIELNRDIEHILKKSEDIYNNLDTILSGVFNIININKNNKLYMLEIYADFYIMYFTYNNNDIFIKINDNGDIIYNNLYV